MVEVPAKFKVDIDENDEICFGQSKTLTATTINGSAPFSYWWTPNSSLDNTDQASVVAKPQTTTKYLLIATDANGCQAIDSMRIVVNPNPVIDSVMVRMENCFGNNGRVDPVVHGGTPFESPSNPYNYHWNNGSFDTLLTRVSVTTGPYYGGFKVTVTDAKGCSATNDTIKLLIDNILIFPDTTLATVCSGQPFECHLSHPDVSNLLMSWSVPGGYNSKLSGMTRGSAQSYFQNQATNITDVPQTVTYNVSTYYGYCVKTVKMKVTVNPTVQITGLPESVIACRDSLLTMVPQLQHVYSGHTVTWMLDDQNIATHTGQKTDATDTNSFRVPIDKCDTTYTLYVNYVDSVQCVASASVPIQVAVPTWNISAAPGYRTIQCQADTVNPLTHYQSEFPVVKDGCKQLVAPVFVSKVSNPEVIECEGTVTYTYRYTACDGSYNDWTYVFHVKDTVKPTFLANVPKTTNATVSSSNCKFFVPDVVDLVKNFVQDNCNTNTSDFTFEQNLEVGHEISDTTYVVVTAYDRCNNPVSTTVRVDVPAPLQAEFTDANIHDVTCNGQSTGSAQVTVSGGQPTYNYLWSDNSNGYRAENLAAGTYKVTVTDANHCTTEAQVEIDEPEVLHFLACPSDTVKNCDASQNYATVVFSDPAFAPEENNAHILSRSGIHNDNKYAPGIYTITYEVANNCGESQTCSFTLTVKDNEQPVIVPPANKTVKCLADLPAIPATYAEFLLPVVGLQISLVVLTNLLSDVLRMCRRSMAIATKSILVHIT